MPHNIPKGLLKKGKFSLSHTTAIEDAVPLLRAAKEDPHVTKIVLGKIDPLRVSNNPHLRFTHIPAGLKMQVRGRNAVQIFYIYTNASDEVRDTLGSIWNK